MSRNHLSAIVILVWFVIALAPTFAQSPPEQGSGKRYEEHLQALQQWYERLTKTRPASGAPREQIKAFNMEYARYAAALTEFKKETALLRNSAQASAPAMPSHTVVGITGAKIQFETAAQIFGKRPAKPRTVAFEEPPYNKAGIIGKQVLRVKGKIMFIAPNDRQLPVSFSKCMGLAPNWENEPLQASADPRDVTRGGTHVRVLVPLILFGPIVYAEGDTFEDIVYPVLSLRGNSGIMMHVYTTSVAAVRRIRAEIENERPPVIGSGFFITGRHVVTNWHVVANGDAFIVYCQDKMCFAELLFADRSNDIAVLVTDNTASTPLPIAPSVNAALGNDVFTVGYPCTDIQGTKPKLTSGKISSLAGIRDDPCYFQISVPIQPGNSGGALVDGQGNVVGIVSAKLRDSAAYNATGAIPQNVNYALKSSLLLSLLDKAPEVKRLLPAPNTTAPSDPSVPFRAAERASALIKVFPNN